MKTYIYARKSTNKLAQKETIENQIAICKYKSIEMKLDIVDVKTDTGKGSDDNNRPEVKELIQDAIDKKYECVIMKGISRFYRDTEKGLGLIKLLDRHSIEENFDSFDQRTGNGKLDLSRITMYLMFAEMESKKTADRVKLQQLDKARKGFWNNAANTPFGYVYNQNTKSLDIDLINSSTINLIFDLYDGGSGIRLITLHLSGENESGIIYKSPNDKWSEDTISYMLKNRSYVGDLIYNRYSKQENIFKRNHKLKENKDNDKEMWVGNVENSDDQWVIIENAFEAIVDREQFKRVQKLLEIKTFNKGIRQEFSLFAGIIKCGLCNGGMGIKRVKSSKKTPIKEYYHCVKYLKYGIKYCSNHRIELYKLEDIVNNRKDLLDDIVNKKSNSKSLLNHEDRDKNKLDYARIEIIKKMDKLLEKNLNGDINDQQFNTMNKKYSDELEQTINKLTELKIKVTNIEDSDSMNIHFNEIITKYLYFEDMNLEEKRSIMLQLINKIEYSIDENNNGNLQIEYRFEEH